MPIDKGFHWSVDARQDRVNSRKQELPFRGAVFAQVKSSLGQDEKVSVDSFLGPKTISFSYPFASQNAWIRGQPEAGSTLLTVIGGDTQDIQPVAYFDPGKAGKVSAYTATASNLRLSPKAAPTSTDPYRALTPGDIDMGSNFAQTFMGLRDVHQSRGGLSHFTMTSQRARLETPQFEVTGPAHFVDQDLNDEIRFGTVRRAPADEFNFGASPTLPTLVRDGLNASTFNPLGGFPFTKEWSIVLDWFGLPGRLIDHRQGHVVDSEGEFIRGTKTQQRLRALMQWFTIGGNTSVEIDETGNWFLGTAVTGTNGGIVEIPTGSFLMDVGQRMNLRAKSDVEITSLLGSLTATATTGFRIATPQIGDIEGTFGLNVKSDGTITIQTPTPAGIQLGEPEGTKYPILVGNPAYVESLQTWYSTEVGLDNLVSAYGSAAGQAWAAIGALMMLLDPSGTTSSLCEAAGAAADAMGLGASGAAAALGDHMPSLAQMPAGFLSQRTISE